MKKILLSLVFLSLVLGVNCAAQAQANLARGLTSAINLGRLATRNTAPDPTISASTYEGKEFAMKRTPADKLTKKSGAQVAELESQLDRCHAAMLADPKGVICTPEQRTALQTAAINLARVQQSSDNQVYQQEAAFYLAENARRQPFTEPATPAK